MYDFLDDYLEENKKTYKDIFTEIAEDINKEVFFNNKMSSSLSSMNMNEVIKNSAEKAIAKVAEQEFQGYRA